MQENAEQERSFSPLLSRKEAAVYLGLSEQTLAIWKCTKRYELPFVKIGRLVKYKKSDLDKFISENASSSSENDGHSFLRPSFN